MPSKHALDFLRISGIILNVGQLAPKRPANSWTRSLLPTPERLAVDYDSSILRFLILQKRLDLVQSKWPAAEVANPE